MDVQNKEYEHQQALKIFKKKTYVYSSYLFLEDFDSP